MNSKLFNNRVETPVEGRSPRRKLWFFLSLILAVFTVPRMVTASASTMPLSSTGTTVITSQRLDFDNRKRLAVFEGDVVVRDDTLQIQSDLLTVVFDEDEQPVRLEADGNVKIMQENRMTRSDSAVYDITAGTMVLTGSAEVQRGNDLLKGDTITFWRDEDRIEVRPGTLIISPQTKGP